MVKKNSVSTVIYLLLQKMTSKFWEKEKMNNKDRKVQNEATK